MSAPVIAEHDVTVYQGDVRERLAEMPAQSVQCVVTSPPYYGLRDYGTGRWEGGSADCDHAKVRDTTAAVATSTLGGGKKSTGHLQEGYGQHCPRCGATRTDRQLGLEPSPAEYVAAMVGVFAEARRVLADDGVLWLNLGDSYASQGGMSGVGPNAIVGSTLRQAEGRTRPTSALAPKNLLGIPWRVAFALQDDGWTLRNDVIWWKPNAMPESVTDRLSTRYEHVFLFSKSRRYWFDLDAVREGEPWQGGQTWTERKASGEPMRYGTAGQAAVGKGGFTSGRNPGDVWQVLTSPFPGAHFACMPPDLARRCILAGCPTDGAVLDPFAGSGTTLMVARQLARKAVGIELNPAYIDIIRRRIGQTPLDFGEATA